jgi:hypothetical protein
MAFSFSGSTSDLRSEFQKIDPSVKDVTRVDGNYKVTYNDGFTRTLTPEGVSQIQSRYMIPTGAYDYDDSGITTPKYVYDYRFVTPQDITKASVGYVPTQDGFDPSTYDVGSGVGLRKLQELLDLGASRQQIVDLFSNAPVIGDRMQQLFPELQGLDPYTPVSGLTPEQLASYDVSTGIGMTKLEDLLNLGATPEQIAEIAGRAPVVGTRLQTLFPQAVPPPPPPTPFSTSVPAFNYVPTDAGLAALAPVAPVSLVQAAEAPTLSPSVQTVAGMKEGGLAAAARQVASAGRGGDTMLAHINPEEAGLLKALGGSGTINPKTGLPDFISLFPKKGISLNFGPLGKVKFGKKSSDLIQAAAALYLGSYMPGGPQMSIGATSAAYGGIRGLATGNLMEGIQAGLTAYGMGSAYQGFGGSAPGATGAPQGSPTGTGSLSSGPAGVESGTVAYDPVVEAYGPLSVESVPATVSTAPGAGFSYPEGSFAYDAGGEFIPPEAAAPLPGPEIVTPSPSGVTYGKMTSPVVNDITKAATATAPDGYLAKTLPASAQEYIPRAVLDASGTTLTAGTLLGAGLIGGAQERQAYSRLEAARKAEEEKKKREYLALFESTLGAVPVRSGGLMKLAGGGMTYMEAGGTTGPTGIPREVTGTGDGMSDSVPATIEGVQEARLADGEFVIPADVVADIGNGSSDAGSKKLYDMMDRIREARHGTTKQPPEIDAEALMPA